MNLVFTIQFAFVMISMAVMLLSLFLNWNPLFMWSSIAALLGVIAIAMTMVYHVATLQQAAPF